MKTDQPEKDFEPLQDAVARLLGRLEATRRKVSGGLERPEPIENGGRDQAAKNALELLPPVVRRGLGGVSLGYLRRNGKVVRAYSAANDEFGLW